MNEVDPTSGLPLSFVQTLHAVFPDADHTAVCASFAAPKSTAARVNTLRTSVSSVVEQLRGDGIEVHVVPGFDAALEVRADHRQALTHHDLVNAGDVYVQGLSSQLAGLLLDPRPGEEVLDLAAAPGGKALHLAARMRNTGRLACVEPVKGRFFKLKANLERAGVEIAALYRKDGRAVGSAVPERFDRVLLDAPCSSEARFRAFEPQTWAHWSPRKIREQARKQKGLLKSAWRALKPGGRLLYMTCAVSPDEDERAVHSLLRRAPEARVIEVDLSGLVDSRPGLTAWQGKALDPRLEHTRRVVPGPRTDSLFVAMLQKA